MNEIEHQTVANYDKIQKVKKREQMRNGIHLNGFVREKGKQKENCCLCWATK